MAFYQPNWSCVSASLSQGQESVIPFGETDPVLLNSPNLFTYGSGTDTVATIIAANYFLPQYTSLSVNDIILGNGSDASFAVQVTAVSSTSVTVASMGLTTSIGTANIENNAVTYAKIQEASAANVLLGNPTGGAANYEEVTLGNGLDFNSTALELSPAFLNHAEVSLTAAQFNGMYATPVSVLDAPGANKVNIVDSALLNMTYVSAAYAAGGAVGLQYGSTDHLGGITASATEAATDFTGASASTLFRFSGGLSTGADTATVANAAIYISNDTAAFTTGDSTFKLHIWYKTVPTNS